MADVLSAANWLKGSFKETVFTDSDLTIFDAKASISVDSNRSSIAQNCGGMVGLLVGNGAYSIDGIGHGEIGIFGAAESATPTLRLDGGSIKVVDRDFNEWSAAVSFGCSCAEFNDGTLVIAGTGINLSVETQGGYALGVFGGNLVIQSGTANAGGKVTAKSAYGGASGFDAESLYFQGPLGLQISVSTNGVSEAYGLTAYDFENYELLQLGADADDAAHDIYIDSTTAKFSLTVKAAGKPAMMPIRVAAPLERKELLFGTTDQDLLPVEKKRVAYIAAPAAVACALEAEGDITVAGELAGKIAVTAEGAYDAARASGFYGDGAISIGSFGSGFQLTVAAKGGNEIVAWNPFFATTDLAAGTTTAYCDTGSAVALGFFAETVSWGKVRTGTAAIAVTATGGNASKNTYAAVAGATLDSATVDQYPAIGNSLGASAAGVSTGYFQWDGTTGGKLNLTVTATGGNGNNQNVATGVDAVGISTYYGIEIGYRRVGEAASTLVPVIGSALAGAFAVKATGGQNGSCASAVAAGFYGESVAIAAIDDKNFSLKVDAVSTKKNDFSYADAYGIDAAIVQFGLLAGKFTVTADGNDGASAVGLGAAWQFSAEKVADGFTLNVTAKSKSELAGAIGIGNRPSYVITAINASTLDQAPAAALGMFCSVYSFGEIGGAKLTVSAQGAGAEAFGIRASGDLSFGAVSANFQLTVSAKATDKNCDSSFAIGIWADGVLSGRLNGKIAVTGDNADAAGIHAGTLDGATVGAQLTVTAKNGGKAWGIVLTGDSWRMNMLTIIEEGSLDIAETNRFEISGAVVANSAAAAWGVTGDCYEPTEITVSGALYAGKNGNAATLAKLAASGANAASAAAGALSSQYRSIDLTGDDLAITVASRGIVAGDVRLSADSDGVRRLSFTIESGAQVFGNLYFLNGEGAAYAGGQLNFSIVSAASNGIPMLTVRDGFGNLDAGFALNITVDGSSDAFTGKYASYTLVRGKTEFTDNFVKSFTVNGASYSESLGGWAGGDGYLYTIAKVKKSGNWDLVLERSALPVPAFDNGPDLGDAYRAQQELLGFGGAATDFGYQQDRTLLQSLIA